MTTIFVDGVSREIAAGQNALQACLALDYDLPYFCWHPALGSVGACRQCAVKQYKDEHDEHGKLVMACMTPANDGLRISIEDPDARTFRACVAEWMMVNHPHDCPVCDEGGECHLQDMIVMTGHTYRRYRGLKRTFENQDLGPFVNHEMNRCIQCYRCVRFYRDYAGGRDLDAFALRNHVYFGRHGDGVLENEFSGNLVEVCPTGVFDDKTLKEHYTRKWDLQTAPSVCAHCSLGCNTIPGERYGMLRRVRNRYHGEVNGYFLCDRGRYGYEFVNSDQRIRAPLLRARDREEPSPVARQEGIHHVGALFASGRLIGIGSSRASLESNFALRSLVGPEHFYAGVSERELLLTQAVLEVLRETPARISSLRDAESADAVVIFGEDVTNTAPRLGLALRQAVRRAPEERTTAMHIPAWDDLAVREAIQDERGPLFIATPYATKLEEVATESHHLAPDDIARLGFAVAHALDSAAPAVTPLAAEEEVVAQRIAAALASCQRPLVVSGCGSGTVEVIRAASAVAHALSTRGLEAGLCMAMPECNSVGLSLMTRAGLDAALNEIARGEVGAVIVLETDLYRHAGADAVNACLSGQAPVVVIDHLMTPTAAAADAVLPAATFAEGDGTLVNNEGRAQRFFQIFSPSGDIQESWRWLRDAMHAAGRDDAVAWQSLDDVVAAIASDIPTLARITEVAPNASYRIAGQKVARQPDRYSGRTAMRADVDVNEEQPPDDPDSALAFSMEGYEGRPASALLPRFWAPGWNSVQALNKFQEEIGGPLRGGDPGRRIFDRSSSSPARVYLDGVPPAFQRRAGMWLIVAMHHIFGSEELSASASAVASLAPAPYLALCAADAARLSAREGDLIGVTLANTAHRLPLRVVPSLPEGVAGLPAGLPALPFVGAPAWSELTVVERSGT